MLHVWVLFWPQFKQTNGKHVLRESEKCEHSLFNDTKELLIFHFFSLLPPVARNAKVMVGTGAALLGHGMGTMCGGKIQGGVGSRLASQKRAGQPTRALIGRSNKVVINIDICYCSRTGTLSNTPFMKSHYLATNAWPEGWQSHAPTGVSRANSGQQWQWCPSAAESRSDCANCEASAVPPPRCLCSCPLPSCSSRLLRMWCTPDILPIPPF